MLDHTPYFVFVATMIRHESALRFDIGDFGKDLIKAATDGVIRTIDAQQNPDGSRWDDLSPDYAAWKGSHFPGQPMARLYDLMADPDEIEGEPDIAPHEATVTYGKSEEARIEAHWFQDPTNPGQPPRKFFGFTQDSIAEIQSIGAKHFHQSI